MNEQKDSASKGVSEAADDESKAVEAMIDRVQSDYPNLTREELREIFHATYEQLARVPQPPEQNSEDKNSVSGASDLSTNRVSKDSSESAAPSEFAMRVLLLFAKYDIYDYLFWNMGLHFFVNVNDVFYWGSADLEEITDLETLEAAINDCGGIDEAGYGCWLYASRKRAQRPQGASYPENQALWPLFDAAGPERETGFGNPYKPGEYKPFPITQDAGGLPSTTVLDHGQASSPKSKSSESESTLVTVNALRLAEKIAAFEGGHCLTSCPEHWTKSVAEIIATELSVHQPDVHPERLHIALHKLWTKAVGQEGYVKAEWRELDDAIFAALAASPVQPEVSKEQEK